MPRALIALSAVVLLLLALPAVGLAQYGQSNTDEVGLAFFPFETEASADRSLAFALEDYVQRNLGGQIAHPVFTGRETSRALQGGIEDCVADPFCVRLFGAQFNSSLAVRVKVIRVDGEVQIETEWYATGNGIRLGRENTAFTEGDDKALVNAFSTWWELYWETSLRVSPESRAGEGGVMDDSRSNETWYERTERESRERRGGEEPRAGRREDFDSDRDTEALFDRDDPTGDLREIAEGGDDRDRDDRDDRRKRDRKNDTPEYRDGDEDLDSDTRSTPKRRSTPGAGRRSPRKKDEIDLDARERRGDSLSSRNSAEQSGMGNREYKRYSSSGLLFDDYMVRRWALKKRAD